VSSIDITEASSIVGIVAHPDDPKMFTGLVLRGLACRAEVSVIWMTNGEKFENRPPDEARRVGTQRKRNLFMFCDRLGIPRSNACLLGFPDGGLTALRTERYPADAQPYVAVNHDADRVTDEDAHRLGTPFLGAPLMDLLEQLLVARQPTHVFTHHPGDDHGDHRATASFVTTAVDNLVSSGRLHSRPDVCVFLTYLTRAGWPREGESFGGVREVMSDPDMGDPVLFGLTPTEQEEKRRVCIAAFALTQGEDYIESYMKADELFWRL